MKIKVAVFAALVAARSVFGLDGYTIVTPEKVSPCDAFVLKDVRGLLARSLGNEPPLVTLRRNVPSKRVFFGVRAPGYEKTPLADQEHMVVVSKGDVYLFGGGINGTRYAAYDFLQNVLGYRFFDARGGVAVPDLKNFVLKDGVRRRRFSFEDRNMSCWTRRNGEKSAMFLFRHGFNGATEGSFEVFFERECGGAAQSDFRAPWPASHALVMYLPRNSSAVQPKIARELCGDNLEKTHPEYFSIIGGKRSFTHQRCLSNRGVREILKKCLFSRMEAAKKPTYFDLSAGDTPGRFCECEGCTGLEKKYGTEAGPLLDVIMELSPEIARRWPGHGVKMLAYRKKQTQRPPKIFDALPENLVPQFAPIDDDFSKDWTHPDNADTLSDLKKWCDMCDKTLVWYYPNPYGGVTPPLGNLERLANDMRVMKKVGVTGLTVEHDVGVREMTGFTEMQSYVLARMWSDVSLDWRKLAREFADFEYGPAADGVLKYLDELEGLRKKVKNAFPWDASRSLFYYDYLTPERFARWEGEFDRMESLLASDRTRLRNLRRVRYNLDNALLAEYRKVKKSLGDAAPDIEEVAGRIEAVAKEITEECFAPKHAGMAADFLKSVRESVFLLKIKGGAGSGNLPKDIFGGIPEEKIFITLPITYDGRRQNDSGAAYGVSVMFEGKKRPEAMKLPFVVQYETSKPVARYFAKIGRGVDAGNIGPRGKYRFYDMGELVVAQDCYIRLNTYWFQSNISGAYVAGSFNKAKVYASLKFQGPAFYPDDVKSKNAVWCDRIVIVRE